MKNAFPEALPKFFTRQTSAKILQTIFNLKSLWRQENLQKYGIPDYLQIPMFSLGASLYLDLNPTKYQAMVKIMNPLLERHFSFYGELQEKLSTILESPAVYDPELALPSFHIFGQHPAMILPNASIHSDLQFEAVPWKHLYNSEPEEVMSFTIPLRLPYIGGGLNYWQDDEKHYLPYTENDLVLHYGKIVHQIAEWHPRMLQDDYRITLQGHGVLIDKKWIIYR